MVGSRTPLPKLPALLPWPRQCSRNATTICIRHPKKNSKSFVGTTVWYFSEVPKQVGQSKDQNLLSWGGWGGGGGGLSRRQKLYHPYSTSTPSKPHLQLACTVYKPGVLRRCQRIRWTHQSGRRQSFRLTSSQRWWL